MKIGISRTAFRWAVVAAFLLDIFLTTYWRTDSHWLPESEHDALALSWNYMGAVLPGDGIDLWWALSTMVRWFCCIALFFFWPVGRWALLILTVMNILITPFLGVFVMPAWDFSITGLLVNLTIFLLTLSFFSPLATEFERKQAP